MLISALKPASQMSIAVAIAIGLISCSETNPDTLNNSPEKSLSWVGPENSAAITNRSANINNDIQQVFGSGFLSTSTGIGITATGIGNIGNTGGFGFGGSITSIIGNVGGFGAFGGFGSFASVIASAIFIMVIMGVG